MCKQVPLDIFSYGGVILHVVNQDWPTPLHYVMTDPDTGRKVALTELERRQEHLEKMKGVPTDLRALVKECLDDDSGKRSPISDIYERMRRMKEAESTRSPHVNMDPTTWQKDLEQLLKDTSISPANAEQVSIFVQYSGQFNWIMFYWGLPGQPRFNLARLDHMQHKIMT